MLPVRPSDVHSLVNGLIQAAELSWGDRKHIALAAQAHVASVHHFDDRLDDLERLYRETAGKPVEMVTQLSLA